MKVIRYGPGDTPIDTTPYPAYLAEVADRLPPGARAYAGAPWHYDFHDHRCPHDAWLESLTFHESPADDRPRRVDLVLRLLGAYHDGHLELRYTDVTHYTATMPLGPRGHGDLMIDEVLLADDGQISHNIAFEDGTWQITCRDLTVTWIDLPTI
jgi:hypothetical protein